VINHNIVGPRAGAPLGRVTRTIVLVGDSVPQRLASDLARAAARFGFVVVSATRGSCPATGVAVVDASGRPWGAGRVCATEVPRRQDAAIAKYRPALVIWWSRYELADRVDAHGKPVAFDTPAYWALQKRAFASRTAALTRYGAIVVAVQVERSGLGMSTRCAPAHCGPFLHRLGHATGAQDTWNAFLASHTRGFAALDRHPRPRLQKHRQPLRRPAAQRLARKTRRDALRPGRGRRRRPRRGRTRASRGRAGPTTSPGLACPTRRSRRRLNQRPGARRPGARFHRRRAPTFGT
jgi:hypothetical protein